MTHAFDRIAQWNRDLLDDSLKSAAAVARGMQTILAETGDCSREVLEKGANTLEKMVGAKDVESVLLAGADCARTVVESGVARSAKVADIYVDLTREAARPLDRFFHVNAKMD